MIRIDGLLLIAGLLAPPFYLAIVIVGGLLTPGYDQFEDPVNALAAAGAPFALPAMAGFVLYNLLLMAFGIGFIRVLAGPSTTLRLAGACITLGGLVGVVLAPVPMDPTGAAPSAAGRAHLSLSGVLVGAMLAAMIAAAADWLRRADTRRAGWLALAMAALMVLAGGLAANAALSGGPLVGLYQRLTVAPFLVFVLLVAGAALRARPGGIRAPDAQR